MAGLDQPSLVTRGLPLLVEMFENLAAIGSSEHLRVDGHYPRGASQERIVLRGPVDGEIGLQQMHVRILLEIPAEERPLSRRRRREPASRQAKPIRDDLVGT